MNNVLKEYGNGKHSGNGVKQKIDGIIDKKNINKSHDKSIQQPKNGQ